MFVLLVRRLVVLVLGFEAGSHVAGYPESGLELLILLPPPPKCWAFRLTPSQLAGLLVHF